MDGLLVVLHYLAIAAIVYTIARHVAKNAVEALQGPPKEKRMLQLLGRMHDLDIISNDQLREFREFYTARTQQHKHNQDHEDCLDALRQLTQDGLITEEQLGKKANMLKRQLLGKDTEQ